VPVLIRDIGSRAARSKTGDSAFAVVNRRANLARHGFYKQHTHADDPGELGSSGSAPASLSVPVLISPSASVSSSMSLPISVRASPPSNSWSVSVASLTWSSSTSRSASSCCGKPWRSAQYSLYCSGSTPSAWSSSRSTPGAFSSTSGIGGGFFIAVSCKNSVICLCHQWQHVACRPCATMTAALASLTFQIGVQTFDVPPALKDGDSHYWRSTSRAENV